MDDSSSTPPPADSGAGATTPVRDHLVGTHQGTRQAFSEAPLRIGTASDAAIHFPADHPAVAMHHATLTPDSILPARSAPLYADAGEARFHELWGYGRPSR